MLLNLAENIREMRRAKGVTQVEMAKHLNVTPQSVSRWENDTAYPDVVMLPKIAKFFDVTLDELMLGQESSHTVYKRELADALNTLHAEECLQNRIRVCEILEVLTREKPKEYIAAYYSNLAEAKRLYGDINEAALSSVREQIALLIRESSGSERHLLLSSVIRCEDEHNLGFWKSFLPEGIFTTWEDYLLIRYEQTGETEKWEAARQKALFENVCKVCLMLTGEKQCQAVSDGEIMQGCFMPEESRYYLLAISILSKFSYTEEDIFLPLRTMLEFGCARSLFWEGKTEKGFEHLTSAEKALCKMWQNKGKTLFGSTSYTEKVEYCLESDTVIGTVLNIWKCESCIEFDWVRDDSRFTDFFEYIDNLIPEGKNECSQT